MPFRAADEDENLERRFKNPKVRWDDDVPEPGRTTYTSADRGPEPAPEWVITTDDAWDTELGLLKTGKEADVHLVERRASAVQGGAVSVMAAKRYRDGLPRRADYRNEHEIAETRLRRAVARRTALGRAVHAEHWARHEFGVLSRLWSGGVAVPYPVQIVGTELLLELVGDQITHVAAPRLAVADVPRAAIADIADQAVTALRGMAAAGIVHADLSAFNLLVDGDRLVVIDLPQAVDVLAHPKGLDLLHRDCRNVAAWFSGRGAALDADELFADCMGEAFS